MTEYSLRRRLWIVVPSQCKNIFNSAVGKFAAEIINFISVITKACKVRDRLNSIFFLYMTADSDRSVIVGAASCSKRNADEVGFELTTQFECCIDINQFFIMLWRKNLKRQYSSGFLVNFSQFHTDSS